MARLWKGTAPGLGGEIRHGGLLALGVPAGDFYFKQVALPPGGVRDPWRFAVAAIDSSLPVAVEDCHVHASRQGDSLAVFAIERGRWETVAREAAGRAGRTVDAMVPLPLAFWRLAASAAGGSAASIVAVCGFGGAVTLLGGRAGTGRDAVLDGVMTVAGSDAAAALRSGRILASRIPGRVGSVVALGDGAMATASSLASAIGAPAPLPVQVPDVAGCVSDYAAARYLSDDFPAREAESRRLGAYRLRRAAAPFFALAAASIALAASTAVADFAARRTAASLMRRINLAAADLSGGPVRQRGMAAVATARGAFAERTGGLAGIFAAEPPRDALRTIFAFADARSIDIGTLEMGPGGISVELAPKASDDLAALVAALAQSGDSAEVVEAGGAGGMALLKVVPGGLP